MARFRFRLDASLRLAEQKLEDARRALAEELRRLDDLKQKRDHQQNLYGEVLEGQRKDALVHPEWLGYWQVYSLEQLEKLRRMEEEVKIQQKAVEQARQIVYLAHQECEKFRRLKEKRWLLFIREEEKKEQAILDEAGQIMNWRLKSGKQAV